MGISGAVHWWEEWQLRVLVLSSLIVQWLLFISAIRRKYVISYWSFRSFTWLAYLGSDAIAIYALAALFNRQRKQDYAAANNRSVLELVWAPILLMHLGGQDCITAYNVEDNELWRRHVLTAVSQITVAIYIFCKSLPRGIDEDELIGLLFVSVMAFIPGILKCLEKPWALKNASINSLASSYDPDPRTTVSRKSEIISLEDYVEKAKKIVDAYGQLPQVVQGQGETEAVDEGDEEDPSPPSLPPSRTLPVPLGIRQPSQLFVDLASPYAHRIDTLRSFWGLDKIEVYASLQIGIYGTFDLLYTKTKMFKNVFKFSLEINNLSMLKAPFFHIRNVAFILPFLAMVLLPSNPTKPYNGNDVKVTYALFGGTAALEFFSLFINLVNQITGMRRLRDIKMLRDMKRSLCVISQYSIVGFFARNQRHNIIRYAVNCFKCKDLVDQLWCMKPCRSSAQIIELVVEYVKKGWKEEIHDAASYRKFSDRRGQWTLGANHQQHLGWSLRRPFDESVLLWHIATDVCFYTSSPHQDAASAPHHGRVAWCETSPHHETAISCREISQYMMYLLFINPEMLLAGTRRNLFTAANEQLEEILKGQNPSSIIDKLKLEEIGIITMLKSEQGSLSQEQKRGFFHEAMALADMLRSVGDEEKVWEVIQGVWVEMLCFSASRCRGYLHAKSLGVSGEFLTYVWLLLSHMGMETLPERLQGVELELRNIDAAPSSSRTEMELPSVIWNADAAQRTSSV